MECSLECSLSMALKGPTFKGKRGKKNSKSYANSKSRVLLWRNSKCYKYNVDSFYLNRWISKFLLLRTKCQQIVLEKQAFKLYRNIKYSPWNIA